MKKFFVKNDKIYYDDTEQNLGHRLPNDVICDILNTLEQYWQVGIKPSNCIDFTKYECEQCKREEYGHTGSWNQEPYLFFCSTKCHNHWSDKRAADNNELDCCPICNQNKMIYDGKADGYWCYGCEQWYECDFINTNYDG
jgi:hypothetical protein